MFVKFSFLQVEPGVTVMDFTGRLSMPGILVAEVELTIKKQIERGAKKLVLDVSKVDFLDSSGVGMLAVCSGAMKEAAGTMVIAGASGIVKKVLETAGLPRVMGMYPDLASACAALGVPHSEPAPPV
jgi:anti-anti-sigma factor